MFNQLSLKIWKDDYSEKFVSFEDYDVFDYVLCSNECIYLSGPSKCGKKHLVYQISCVRNTKILLLNFMSDSEIIECYDSIKKTGKFAVFVLSLNSSLSFSKDVESRLNSLMKLNISQLSNSNFLNFLNLRLSRVGIFLDKNILKYSLSRLNFTYSCVDQFIAYLVSTKIISMKNLKKFFDVLNEQS